MSPGGVVEALLNLSHELGRPEEDLAILAEGNASAREDDATFWVKASGASMGSLAASGLVHVRAEPLLNVLRNDATLSDTDVRALLGESRVDAAVQVMPSVETFMHAGLLTLPDVHFIGHTHPTPLLSLLSTEQAADLATARLFPDEIVCCGPESVFVPYTDPGLPLARAILRETLAYVDRWGSYPKTIWLGNHGLIALGSSASAVVSASRMAAKAARVWLGALSTGTPIRRLTAAEIDRIHTRPDEHYRQRLLWQASQTPR